MTVLRTETAGAIRSLFLTRPAAGNALNRDLIDSLQRAVDDVGADASIRALIISGDGPKFFCTGGDVREFAGIAAETELSELLVRLERLFRAFGTLRIPVIAAVNGYALGAGAELAIASDIRIAGGAARIGFTQTSIGVLPTLYSLRRLRSICGHGVACELILGAATLSAEEAAARRLASQVVAPGDEHAAALELARRLAGNCPLALSAAKEVLAPEMTPDAELDAGTRRIFPRLWFSPFHRAAERRFAARSASRSAG
jgi:enoyl-CoA hydratase/carnithine racemase